MTKSNSADSPVPAKKRLRTKTLVAAGVMASAAALSTINAGDASAAWAAHTGDHTVCANTLTLRAAPGGGIVDTMIYGERFYISSNNNQNWVYGYDYAVAKWGWVVNGWFC